VRVRVTLTESEQLSRLPVWERLPLIGDVLLVVEVRVEFGGARVRGKRPLASAEIVRSTKVVRVGRPGWHGP
jgi:hypothetical protein